MSDDLRSALAAKRGYPTDGVSHSRHWVRDPDGAYVGFEDAWDVVLLALATSDEPEHEAWCYRRHSGDCVDGPTLDRARAALATSDGLDWRDTLRATADCLGETIRAIQTTQPQMYRDDWEGQLAKARAALRSTPEAE